jgi:hypothetical protein
MIGRFLPDHISAWSKLFSAKADPARNRDASKLSVCPPDSVAMTFVIIEIPLEKPPILKITAVRRSGLITP